MSPRARRTDPRSRVVPVKVSRAVAQALMDANSSLIDDETRGKMSDRPLTRGDCVGGPRPCPWVGCRHHLGIEVTPNGGLKLVRPDLEPWELEQTCSLDVADAGASTLDSIGRIVNLTRERTRQIELSGVRALRREITRRARRCNEIVDNDDKGRTR